MSNPLGKYTAPDGSVHWIELACDAEGKLLVAGTGGAGGDASPLTNTELRAAAVPVAGTAATGTAPTLPPLSISGVDGGGLKRHLLTDPTGRQVTVTAPPIEIRTNVGAVSAGAWVPGETLDLGPAATRQHTRLLFCKYGVASAGESLSTQWSDDGVVWNSNVPAAFGAGVANTNAFSNISSAQMSTQGIPPGRYVRLAFSNGATPQTALQLFITAIAGI